MRIVLAAIRIVLTIITLAWYLGWLLLFNAIRGFDLHRGYRFRRWYTSTALKILGVDITVQGESIEGCVLYVSNHRSLLDPFIQLNRLDAYIVSKAEVSKYPLFGAGARATGVIFVERTEASSRSGAREAIRQCLRARKPVLIYPEGTTSKLPATRDFRRGSFEIAAEENVVVVPVAIEYKDPADRWQDMAMLKFFLRKFSKWRTSASLHIGEPIQGTDSDQLMREAQDWINRELKAMQQAFASEQERK
jgi:1-acyl-sn-glycerol-3-phosphate acyltransferase